MVDISKYKELVELIESYDGAMNSERNYYFKEMDQHPADFVKISAESNRNEESIKDERLLALKKAFPNIVFSMNDVELLSNFYTRKKENKSTIIETELAITYSQRGDKSVSKSQIEEMNIAKEKQPNLESQYTDAYTNFFEVCEKLSNTDLIENPEFDFEGEIFSTIYEKGFSLRPENPMLKKYYETYKSSRDNEKENKTISEQNSKLSEQVDQVIQENTQLLNDNEKLKNDNNELKTKNSKLQSMLAKTLKFCDYVRESKFGKFFFRKKIKELPEPQSIENER